MLVGYVLECSRLFGHCRTDKFTLQYAKSLLRSLGHVHVSILAMQHEDVGTYGADSTAERVGREDRDENAKNYER